MDSFEFCSIHFSFHICVLNSVHVLDQMVLQKIDHLSSANPNIFQNSS